MDAQTLRRVPWTCRWGRFAVAVEEVVATDARVDGVFWGCHHPITAPDMRLLRCHECEHCPYWELATRLMARC